MNEFKLEENEEFIPLIQLLKAAGLVRSGGEAKQLVDAGLVTVNSQPESRKRAKLRKGDVVEYAGKKVVIV